MAAESDSGDEFGVDEQGRLDLPGLGEAADECPPGRLWDEEVDAGWEPGEYPEPWEDPDEDAWLRSMPPELRAEVEARPPVTAVPWASGPQVARKAFDFGGLGDLMIPGRGLAELLAEATGQGFRELTDDQLTGMLRG
ncbi:MAG: hypothetical protein J2P28_13430, partial [Actinobacteria bacterium]|nr:hypothetical protein [Actinomycetota bacterium]